MTEQTRTPAEIKRQVEEIFTLASLGNMSSTDSALSLPSRSVPSSTCSTVQTCFQSRVPPNLVFFEMATKTSVTMSPNVFLLKTTTSCDKKDCQSSTKGTTKVGEHLQHNSLATLATFAARRLETIADNQRQLIKSI